MINTKLSNWIKLTSINQILFEVEISIIITIIIIIIIITIINNEASNVVRLMMKDSSEFCQSVLLLPFLCVIASLLYLSHQSSLSLVFLSVIFVFFDASLLSWLSSS